jgi:cytoplasmic iron level regulating protein YaaA (DUF328/UPF0246 family)
MKTIILIGCGKKKRDYICKAEDLYISFYFKNKLAFAKSLKPDSIFILSAKYGLVPLNMEIAPYDLTLNKYSEDELREWSANTLQQLRIKTDLEKDKFIFLAGKKYQKHLLPKIRNYENPLEGLGIGKQNKLLKNKLQ